MSMPESNRIAAPGGAQPVSVLFEPLLRVLFGEKPGVRFEFWDGSALGPLDGADAVLVRSPNAVRRILWAPGELGLSRAYVAGDIDIEGDAFTVMDALWSSSPARGTRVDRSTAATALGVARKLGALGLPMPPPPEEARQRGRRHSKGRDAQAISHHYDVGNDFYRLFLGPSMTYSCARFAEPGFTLEDAQAAKYELICRKLGLPDRPGARLLDIGCGWGSMAMHAAAHYGAEVVGVTISAEQAAAARERVAAAGLADKVEIRLQDYRDLTGETFDAVSSIGMFEHVGKARTAEYFTVVRALLRPQGRLLNHAISSVGGSVMGRNSFIGSYVFPDGELIDVGDVVLAMERAGFEVRDVESLREHYAKTLRHWVHNLESGWDEALSMVGRSRARVWRLYMAASALSFEQGSIGVHQVLGVVPDPVGSSGMAATRREWN
jgi:cyclopropane-fatty-acyl-phospholipid synthase